MSKAGFVAVFGFGFFSPSLSFFYLVCCFRRRPSSVCRRLSLFAVLCFCCVWIPALVSMWAAVWCIFSCRPVGVAWLSRLLLIKWMQDPPFVTSSNSSNEPSDCAETSQSTFQRSQQHFLFLRRHRKHPAFSWTIITDLRHVIRFVSHGGASQSSWDVNKTMTAWT